MKLWQRLLIFDVVTALIWGHRAIFPHGDYQPSLKLQLAEFAVALVWASPLTLIYFFLSKKWLQKYPAVNSDWLLLIALLLINGGLWLFIGFIQM